MRKILLATAAGFAAFVADGVAPAKAQAPAPAATPQPGITVAIRGYQRFHYANVSQKNGQSGLDANGNTVSLDKNDFNSRGQIQVLATGRTADGLIYGADLVLNIDGNRPPADILGGQTAISNRAVEWDEMYTFVALPSLGRLEFGDQDGAVSQLRVISAIEGFGAGGVNGDLGSFATTRPVFFESGQLGLDDATKIIYLSPQFFGFDFGASFAWNLGDGRRGCGTLSTACQTLKSTDQNINRARNIFDFALRYRGTFGPVAFAANGGVTLGSAVDIIGAADYKAPRVYNIGATATFAGFTVGAEYLWGRINTGGMTGLLRQNQPDADGARQYFLGATYTFGPFVVGAHYYNLKTEGNQTNPADRTDQGYAFGGRYTIAPGLQAVAEFVEQKARERGTTDIRARMLLAGVRMAF
ncbi:porin [Elioraea tepida]|uniref:Porin n=1 Tax=Elioraea tepida TaxID=2843330 RepID=A0A975YKQ6_9PROT|nr:porin [Elioraea tepida]QXM26020.1 porin [Elioraea tepida]